MAKFKYQILSNISSSKHKSLHTHCTFAFDENAFLTEIQIFGDIDEDQPANFEATVESVDDPDFKIS